jgi:hypothetical protein
MGFSVVGPDHFLGSGHPGSVRDAPPFLGLIESRDAGRSWKPVSLRGEVDFHVLESSGQTVYGFGSDFDSRELRFLRSDDRGRKWTALAPPEPLMSLAIDPADPLRVIGLGEGGAHLSRDGGRGWRRVDLPGGFVGWTAETGLTAIDLTGQVRTADDPTGPWRETGRVDGPPATVEAQGAELLVALHDGSIAASKDRGATWRELVPATTPR